MRNITPIAIAAMLAAGPAMAQEYGLISLRNTNFVVFLGFVLFLALLVYFKVPGYVGQMLDRRSEGIQSELDEARNLREEAQALLSSYERKQREVQNQADRIVENARKDAQANAEKAKKDLETSIERRLQAAEDQIGQAEAKAVKEVRDRAINVAVAAASDVLRRQYSGDQASKLIDNSIKTVDTKLH